MGLDRLSDLTGRAEPPPVIFAPNHHSHLDTGLMVRAVPAAWRNWLVTAAAADYFFDKRWKAGLSALALNAIPIDRESTGRLWVTYTQKSRLWVAHSDVTGTQWTAGFQPNVGDVTISSDSDEATIEQTFFEVAAESKLHALETLLLKYRPESAVVFCNTRQEVRAVADHWRKQGSGECFYTKFRIFLL